MAVIENYKAKEIIRMVASMEHTNTLNKYKDVNSKCIKTSDNIVVRLKAYGIKAKAKRVYVLYEKFENCMCDCYEEHWIVDVPIEELDHKHIFIDATIKQFQWAFSLELPDVYINYEMPKFYLVRKPGEPTLKKCGWTDYYNTGNYVNKFEYYRYRINGAKTL